MTGAPLILVAPGTDKKGEEFADPSISLSNRYTDALIAAGAIPWVFPATDSLDVIAESVRRCDGVLLTGGDDLNPKLYVPRLPKKLAKTVGPIAPERDAWEQELIAQIFRQGKSVFGICRGHQILNVALGGSLIVDIPTQVPNSLRHSRMDRKTRPVHSITIAHDSLLARITGRTTLAVNSTHHQSAGRVGKPLRPVAQAADGVIEALELKDPRQLPFFLSVQFHPERLIEHDALFLNLFTSFVAACSRTTRK